MSNFQTELEGLKTEWNACSAQEDRKRLIITASEF